MRIFLTIFWGYSKRELLLPVRTINIIVITTISGYFSYSFGVVSPAIGTMTASIRGHLPRPG
jgi:hypothetical protein